MDRKITVLSSELEITVSLTGDKERETTLAVCPLYLKQIIKLHKSNQIKLNQIKSNQIKDGGRECPLDTKQPRRE